MKSPGIRSLMILFLLLVVLAAALWLADATERGLPLTPLQGRAARLAGAGPSFYPPPGEYHGSLRISLSPSVPRAPIVFAIGGAVPTLTVGTLYERPLLLDGDLPGVTVVRAREIVNGQAGPLASASYAIGLEHTLPILSIAADPPDLWDTERGILANAWQRGQEWERPVHITYIENGQVGFALPVGLRTQGNRRANLPKQSLRLYFRADYGAGRLDYSLFPDHPYQDAQSYNHLLLEAGNRSGRWTLLEDPLLADVAAEIGGRVAQGRFVLLFVNGESWGIYRLSERVDRFFLQDNLGIQSADLIRYGDIEEGDSRHWDALLEWIATHDLSDETHYAYVETQMEVRDFSDYAILQLYFGFPPDRFNAARPRTGGGRWFWLYGSFRDEWTLGSDEESILAPGNDDLNRLLQGLLANPGYRATFIRRAADLLNTVLSPAAMEARVERLAAQVRPDIAYETARWPTPADWEDNVAALRDLVRRRPDSVRQQIVRALGLRGTAAITITVSPAGSGRVFVNGTPLWNGVYFLDSEVEAIAVPAPGYVFAGWEGAPAAASTTLLTVAVEAPLALTARFAPVPTGDRAVRPNDVIVNEYWINDNGTRYASLGGRPIEGDWLELRVARAGTVDLRGWRITDSDTKTGTQEGSLIVPHVDALAAVPHGTVILIIATVSDSNAANFEQDDLDPRDGRLIFYVGNGNLDTTTDPGFAIGTGDDSVVVLAPGATPDLADDVGVDFVAEGSEVTPYSFGVLAEGVVFESPFRGLGADDGAIFTGAADNDDGSGAWIVDPPADQTADSGRRYITNVLSPGAPNPGQGESLLRSGALWLALAALAVVATILYWRFRRRHDD